MGGEGANWIGLAPYTGTKHIFQNMGDGTYYHSGLLAIRAAVASGVNITYKILYNDAVAMTGGQPVDGPLSVAEIAHQVRHEGVKAVVLVSDQPETHIGNPALPRDVRVEHRDGLDAVQRELREIEGCTVLLYEQTCAAEKRRRRKRGTFPNPPKRLFISKAVCEGCGDCSAQSTCVSLMPVETEFGTKRRIDQSSCNKDYSCLNGFCPSFITVHGAEPRKPATARLDQELFLELRSPQRPAFSDGTFNVIIAGIGGTGVITVAAILVMAAHIERLAASSFDMTGLAQKNGAVFSHVRIANSADRLHAAKLGQGEADALLAFDLVGAVGAEVLGLLTMGRTRALVNSDVTPMANFQFDRDASIDVQLLLRRLQSKVGPDRVETVDATALASNLLGDSIAANLFMLGVAAQQGILPVGVEAIERAVDLNGTAIGFNLKAFRFGRLFVENPDRVAALLPIAPTPVEQTLDEVVAHRSAHLVDYQDRALADRYRGMVALVRKAEAAVAPGEEGLTRVVARLYARLLSYKDEYEVARLLSSPELKADLERTFADGGRYEFNLASPSLGGQIVNGRPVKRAFNARWMHPVLRVVARCKGLRGSPFDPFGRTAERRAERALACEYEALVRSVISTLTPETHTAAVTLLGLADMVRGYGPVKDAAMQAYTAALDKAQAAYLSIPQRAAAVTTSRPWPASRQNTS